MESTRDFLPVIRPTLPSLDELAKCIATSSDVWTSPEARLKWCGVTASL